MMHLARRAGLAFPVFTLDTGLLFPETVELQKRLEDFFGCKIQSVVPDLTVEQQEEAQGPELWKRDPDLCCTLRKVLPLAIQAARSGLLDHRPAPPSILQRAAIGVVELYALEAGAEIVKLNPMANWTREAVWRHISQYKIPYNPLHDLGYTSIGCMTCTRQTANGEGERAGRWTGFKKVECGIHTFMSRKIDFQI